MLSQNPTENWARHRVITQDQAQGDQRKNLEGQFFAKLVCGADVFDRGHAFLQLPPEVEGISPVWRSPLEVKSPTVAIGQIIYCGRDAIFEASFIFSPCRRYARELD